MGLFKAIGGSIKGVFVDQWKEYFYCDAMEDDVLVVKASKRTNGAFGTKNNANDKRHFQCATVLHMLQGT